MRKSIAIILGIVLALQTPVSLFASENVSNSGESIDTVEMHASNYVVLMQEDTDPVYSMSAQDEMNSMVVTEAAEEKLEEQNIAVLELTPEEAEQLENREDVLAIEEDITLNQCCFK